MNVRNICILVLMVFAGAGLVPRPAMANRPAGAQISGVLSAVHSDGYIVVSGRTYHVKSDGVAANALRKLEPGSMVTVTLDGSPDSSTSQVINIAVRHGDK